jgi:hypothetical protein
MIVHRRDAESAEIKKELRLWGGRGDAAGFFGEARYGGILCVLCVSAVNAHHVHIQSTMRPRKEFD